MEEMELVLSLKNTRLLHTHTPCAPGSLKLGGGAPAFLEKYGWEEKTTLLIL